MNVWWLNIDYAWFSAMKQYNPQDATTNPSLILAAAKLAQYDQLIDQAVQYAKSNAQ